MSLYQRFIALFVGGALFGAAIADTPAAETTPRGPTVQKTSFAPARPAQMPAPAERAAAATRSGPYIFSAPPRGAAAEETAMYQPIAEFLSRVTGKEFVYRDPDNWLNYSKEMTRGDYDLAFDGPAFNGWRMAKQQHTPLVRLPEDFVFVVITRPDSPVQKLRQLAGQTVCAHAPPNLGTLTLLSQFDNPVRQPVLVPIRGWDNAFAALVDGKCVATVVPLKNLEKNDRDGKLARTLYRHAALPNQAISAGPRIPNALREQIREALLSEEGRVATSALRAAYAGKNFVPAKANEYAGLGVYLKDTLYYGY